MVLKYDEKTLQLYVLVGPDETYEPQEDLVKAQKALAKIRAKIEKIKQTDAPSVIKDIQALLVKYNGVAKATAQE